MAILANKTLNDKAFLDPRLQGGLLNHAIVDGFPIEIPGSGRMYSPGRTPAVKGELTFIHLQNLAWLSHQIILNGNTEVDTHQITEGDPLTSRMLRILLIANDLLDSGPRQELPITLQSRRAMSLEQLRHWQFVHGYEPRDYFERLARQRILMRKVQEAGKFDVDEAYRELSGGISLEVYFGVLTLLIPYFFEALRPGRHWMIKANFFAELKANRESAERILERWILTPEQYRYENDKWRKLKPNLKPERDYTVLRTRPLIEARPGFMVCPIPQFFLDKIDSELYYLISYGYRKKDSKKGDLFRSEIGVAYEEYANELVGKMGSFDSREPWNVETSPKPNWLSKKKKEDELADGYLQRDTVVVAFEHKGQRPPLEFWASEEGDRVLGPPDQVLQQLETGSLDAGELKQKDKGYLSKGIYQQTFFGQYLREYANQNGRTPTSRIFPLITYLADTRVDYQIYFDYLKHLIKDSHAYPDAFWQPPQWLHVSDLENLAGLAEKGTLDLEFLLEDKNRRHRYKRFDIYLHEKFGRNFQKVWLEEEVRNMVSSSRELLFR